MSNLDPPPEAWCIVSVHHGPHGDYRMTQFSDKKWWADRTAADIRDNRGMVVSITRYVPAEPNKEPKESCSDE